MQAALDLLSCQADRASRNSRSTSDHARPSNLSSPKPKNKHQNVRRVKRVGHDPGVSGEAVPMWIATVRNGSVLIISDSARCAAPYANRQTRAMREKVEILERAGQMVLAAHRTPVGSGLTAVTVETVTLDPPNRMGFRLQRGPVPHVIETFTFEETADGTRLSYTGELGTDLWRLGQAWGDLVARSWVQTVRDSIAAIKTESERRAHV
jgi:hypothetical protein